MVLEIPSQDYGAEWQKLSRIWFELYSAKKWTETKKCGINCYVTWLVGIRRSHYILSTLVPVWNVSKMFLKLLTGFFFFLFRKAGLGQMHQWFSFHVVISCYSSASTAYSCSKNTVNLLQEVWSSSLLPVLYLSHSPERVPVPSRSGFRHNLAGKWG